MTLKTMKDIEKTIKKAQFSFPKPTEGERQRYIQLQLGALNLSKQEAIKHIKDRRKRIDEIYKGCFLEPNNFNGDWVQQNEAIIFWMKYFFNITEEDLE